MKLTPKQRATLKGLANPIKDRYLLGKGELDANIIDMLDKALEAKELIKVSLLQNSELDKDEVAEELEKKLDCGIVQTIGRVIVVYRPSKKHKKIVI